MRTISGLVRHVLWFDALAGVDEHAVARLADIGWHASLVDSAESLLDAPRGSMDAVAVRVGNDSAGIARLIQGLLQAGLKCPLVVRVEPGDVSSAAHAARAGASHVVSADDFSFESWRNVSTLTAPEGSAPQAHAPASGANNAGQRLTAVFVDPVSRHLLALARRVAWAEVTTLLAGPTGAGKEVLARVLHEASPRAQGPFVAFNCAALPEHLIEDMLFGHERGAFTGAHREHKGLFEQAHGGTLFLDEIGDMPMHLQARLLRVLQERQITRLGGSALITLDVRVVAATAQDLKAAIAEKRFREDLYYRISTFLLQLAPLRDRPSDILPLAISMLQRHPAPGAARWEITEAAAHRLLSHAWPGNVRELDNVIRRAVVLADSARIGLLELVFDDVPGGAAGTPSNAALQPSASYPNWRAADMAELSTVAESSPAHADQRQSLPLDPTFDAHPGVGASASMRPPASGALTDAVRENEMRIVRATLESCASRDEAARRLGISPRTLRHKLAQWRQLGLMAA